MMQKIRLLILSCLLVLPSCVGLVVDTAVDTTVAVAKIPFRVAGVAVDAVISGSERDRNTDAQDN